MDEYIIVYDLGNMADWLIAIGTIGAVIVSLYFSFNNSRKKAKVIKGYKETLIQKQLFFRIINTGKIPIEVSTSRLSIYNPWWSKEEERVIKHSDSKPKILRQSTSKTMYCDSYIVDKKLKDYGVPCGKKIKLIYTFRDTEGARYSKVFSYTAKEPVRLEDRVLTKKELEE